MKERPAGATTPFCLLDLSIAELEVILGDEKLSTELSEFDNSSALAKIDELISTKEAGQTVILLNNEAVTASREEWTVDLPGEIIDSIRVLLTVNTKIVY